MDVRDKLKKLHAEEDAMNFSISGINKKIKELQKEKAKIANRISANMKYRNKLINQL
jgi:DNA helicase IV